MKVSTTMVNHSEAATNQGMNPSLVITPAMTITEQPSTVSSTSDQKLPTSTEKAADSESTMDTTLELGGKKPLESAQTPRSMKINPDGLKNPLLKDTSAAVPVQNN